LLFCCCLPTHKAKFNHIVKNSFYCICLFQIQYTTTNTYTILFIFFSLSKHFQINWSNRFIWRVKTSTFGQQTWIYRFRNLPTSWPSLPPIKCSRPNLFFHFSTEINFVSSQVEIFLYWLLLFLFYVFLFSVNVRVSFKLLSVCFFVSLFKHKWNLTINAFRYLLFSHETSFNV